MSKGNKDKHNKDHSKDDNDNDNEDNNGKTLDPTQNADIQLLKDNLAAGVLTDPTTIAAIVRLLLGVVKTKK